MADKKTKKDLYNAPMADEANGKWKGLVKYCLDLYEDSKGSEYRARKLKEIKESVATYQQEDQPTSDPWQGASNITLPLTTISCDNLEPRMVAGLVGKMPYIRFEMALDQPKDEPSEILEAWYNQELEDVVNIKALARGVTHKLLQEGTIYVLPSYDINETTVREFVFEEDAPELLEKEPETAVEVAEMVKSGTAQFQGGVMIGTDGEPITRDIQTTIFEGGKAELVDFNDVFIPDDGDDWEATPVVRKVYPTYADLVRDNRDKEGYQNIGPWLVDQEGSENLHQDQITETQAYESVKYHGKKTVECIECSISYVYRDEDTEEKDQTDFTEERLIAQIAVDSKILVRLIPLKDLNFKNQHLLKRVRLFPEKGKSCGTGIPTKLKAIQKGASKTFNTAINVAEITLLPWFLFEESTGLKSRYPDGVKLEIGKGIPVDSVKGLHFPRFSINPDQFMNWINLWVSFWERVVSIGDLQVGRQGEKDRTATETMAVIQEGNIKHNYQSSSVRDDFASIIRTIYDLYYQHMPLDKKYLWNDKEVGIPRSKMRRVQNFRLTGSTDLSNKLIERQEKELFHDKALSNPNINPVKAAEELVKAYGHTDTAEWVSPNIKGIVDVITQTPGMDQAVMQFMNDFAQMQQEQAKGAPTQ